MPRLDRICPTRQYTAGLYTGGLVRDGRGESAGPLNQSGRGGHDTFEASLLSLTTCEAAEFPEKTAKNTGRWAISSARVPVNSRVGLFVIVSTGSPLATTSNSLSGSLCTL